MVAEEKPEWRMKQSEPTMNAKEEGSTIGGTQSAMIRRTRGVHREKGRQAGGGGGGGRGGGGRGAGRDEGGG